MSCRLCNGSENLTDIFDVEWENMDGHSFPATIEVMTGIRIAPTDVISTKVCPKCVKAVRKHMKFRLKCFRRLMETEVSVSEPEPTFVEEVDECSEPKRRKKKNKKSKE